MTWQRIDDDTYIDDTLVTCVEYQLFIDEMHEEGKYYQPDHWLGMQFSPGNANTPILGIRFSDAIAFCQWLSARSTDKRQFRLPTLDEARSYPLYIDKNYTLGYWVISEPEQNKGFVYTNNNKSKLKSSEEIGGMSVNHVVDFDSMFDRSRSINSNSVESAASFNEIDVIKARVLYRGLDDDIRELSRTRPNTKTRDFASEIALASARALYRGLNGDIIRANNLFRENVRVRASQRTQEIEFGDRFNQILDRTKFRAVEIAHLTEIMFDLFNNLTIEGTRANDRKIVGDLYADLFALNERITGRINPVEGIRIVKEGRLNKKVG